MLGTMASGCAQDSEFLAKHNLWGTGQPENGDAIGRGEVSPPVAEAMRLVDADKPRAAMVVLEKAIEAAEGPEDELLYRLGMLRLSPMITDHAGARAAFSRITDGYPDSPYRDAARAILGLIDQMDAYKAENASLREDLKKILDIDLEAERLRRGGPPAAP